LATTPSKVIISTLGDVPDEHGPQSSPISSDQLDELELELLDELELELELLSSQQHAAALRCEKNRADMGVSFPDHQG